MSFYNGAIWEPPFSRAPGIPWLLSIMPLLQHLSAGLIITCLFAFIQSAPHPVSWEWIGISQCLSTEPHSVSRPWVGMPQIFHLPTPPQYLSCWERAGNLLCRQMKLMKNRWRKMKTVIDFTFSGSKITADGDWSHEIKGHLLLGWKAMTNLDKVFKSREITLLTKVHIVKAMVFPIVMYGCESWTIEKAEHRIIDAFELWFWKRLLRVPWTAGKSNQLVLKEINAE